MPDTIAILDIIFRSAGVALLLVQAGLLLRDARDVKPARFGALLAIALAAIMVVDGPKGLTPPSALITVLLPLNTNTAIFIWWFGLALFNDDFRLRRREWLGAALWFGLGLVNVGDYVAQRPPTFEWAVAGRYALAVIFVVDIVYRALAGRKDDLLEARRRVRLIFTFLIVTLFLVDLLGEAVFGYLDAPIALVTVQHAVYLTVMAASTFWLLRAEKSVLVFDRAAPAVMAPPPVPALSPKEQVLHRKLVAAMEEERLFLDPDLSIGALAAGLGAPEHQLRALINAAMGFRNFRAYLNDYRLAAVKRDLADAGKAPLPILTIAMDAGFASLSSFNRAFKDATGSTPSEWREAALKRPAADQN